MANGKTDKHVEISPPNFQLAEFRIVGTAPLVINKMSAKGLEMMRAKQEAGQTGRKGKARTAKDFDAAYKGAMRVSREGWHGFAAPSIRNSMIRACSLVGFTMTQAKMSVFCEHDGLDKDDAMPLVKLDTPGPEYTEMVVRNKSGVADIRARPMYPSGWEATVRLNFDADQFTLTDVSNLLLRAGMQVGIGEGRPASKDSAGMGWGTFTIKDKKKKGGE